MGTRRHAIPRMMVNGANEIPLARGRLAYLAIIANGQRGGPDTVAYTSYNGERGELNTIPFGKQRRYVQPDVTPMPARKVLQGRDGEIQPNTYTFLRNLSTQLACQQLASKLRQPRLQQA